MTVIVIIVMTVPTVDSVETIASSATAILQPDLLRCILPALQFTPVQSGVRARWQEVCSIKHKMHQSLLFPPLPTSSNTCTAGHVHQSYIYSIAQEIPQIVILAFVDLRRGCWIEPYSMRRLLPRLDFDPQWH